MTTTEPPHAPAGSLRELLHVAFPLMISAGSLSLMNVVDRVFLAHISVDALAASMPTVMLSWTAMSLPLGIAGYTNAFVSQYEGAGRRDRMAASVWQGVFFSVIAGLLLVPPMILAAPWIFASMGHAPHVQAIEIAYFRTLCPVALPNLTATVLSAYFTARRRTAVVMWVNVSMALLNGVLDYLLMFGFRGWPGMGPSGAAAATVTAQAVGVVIFAWLLARDARAAGYPFAATCRVDWDLLSRMFRYGFPQGVQLLLDIGAFTLFTALVGQLGTTEQAATNLAFTLNSLAFVPMLGMGTAVLTLVGRRIGEGAPGLAAQTVWKAFAISGGYMLAFAALYLSLPDLILTPFMHASEQGDFASIRPIVVALLRFVALYSFFDAMAIIFGAAVRGAGDTWFSLVFIVSSSWLIMVLPTVWLIRHGGGLYGCWNAVTAVVIVQGLGFLFRFLQGKWQTMRVIEHEPIGDLR